MFKVGISCRVTEANGYDELRNSLAIDWLTLFDQMKITPVLIPNGLRDPVKYCRDLCLDAIILSGGNNVNPKLYQSDQELSEVYDIRDKTEFSLISYCIEKEIPLLGVCRGMFIINTFFNGSLTHNVKGHVCSEHPIMFQDYTDIFGTQGCVNSYHNQAIYPNNLAESLVPFAHANDGSIEAIKHSQYHIHGLMWHPERNGNGSTTQKFIRMIFTKGDEV
jgi:gamma-glutamyl-gamma-aminobutyrate hydrolase PuuD